MFIKKPLLSVGLAMAAISTFTLAQTPNENEKRAYCRHAHDQADAERTLDTGVEVMGRLGQSDSNPTAKQAVIGVSKSLSRHLQGNSTVRAAMLECELYGRTLDVQRIVKYKMAKIDRLIARARVDDLQDLLRLFDEEIAAAEKKIQSGNATIADVFTLRQQRLQFYGQLITANGELTDPEMPEIPDIDIEDAMQAVTDITLRLQQEQNYKQALKTWDVTLLGGLQKPFSGQSDGTPADYRPFVSLNFTYNLNASAYKHALATATSSLMALRQQQHDALDQQVSLFKKAIHDKKDAQKRLLPGLTSQIRNFSTQMATLKDVKSAAAARMKSQLRIGLAIATMEQHLVNLKIALLSA